MFLSYSSNNCKTAINSSNNICSIHFLVSSLRVQIITSSISKIKWLVLEALGWMVACQIRSEEMIRCVLYVAAWSYDIQVINFSVLKFYTSNSSIFKYNEISIHSFLIVSDQIFYVSDKFTHIPTVFSHSKIPCTLLLKHHNFLSYYLI